VILGRKSVYQGVRLRGLSSAGRSLRNQGGAPENWVAVKVRPWRDNGREEEEASAVSFGFVYRFYSRGGRLRSGKEEGGERCVSAKKLADAAKANASIGGEVGSSAVAGGDSILVAIVTLAICA